MNNNNNDDNYNRFVCGRNCVRSNREHYRTTKSLVELIRSLYNCQIKKKNQEKTRDRGVQPFHS